MSGVKRKMRRRPRKKKPKQSENILDDVFRSGIEMEMFSGRPVSAPVALNVSCIKKAWGVE